MSAQPVDVLAASDAALLAEYLRPEPKHRGTYKVERKRANRRVKVRAELERRGLIEPLSEVLARVQGGQS